MQKKLLSLAIAGALAAPAAAMADVTAKDGADVNIYGKFHASWDYVDNDASGDRDDTDDNTAVFRNSRLGFRGAEVLSPGLKGIWQVETYINTNGNDVTLRNTFVGLCSDTWGTIKFGKHDTPYKMSTAKLDIFSDTIADYNNIMGAHRSISYRPIGSGGSNELYEAQTVSLDFNERLNQLLMYQTPNFNGFEAAIARESFQIDEDTLESVAAKIGSYNDNGTARNWYAEGDDEWETWSFMAKYDQGPYFASLGYEIYEGVNNHSADGDEEIDAWKVALGYTYGNSTISAMYEDIDSDGSDDEPTTGFANSAGQYTYGSLSREAWGVNFKHKFGNNVIKMAYFSAEDSDKDDVDDGADNWSIGIDHNFSKRTTVYAIYTHMDNEREGDYGLYAPGNGDSFDDDLRNTMSNNYYVGGDGVGEDIDAFSIGIVHKF